MVLKHDQTEIIKKSSKKLLSMIKHSVLKSPQLGPIHDTMGTRNGSRSAVPTIQ